MTLKSKALTTICAFLCATSISLAAPAPLYRLVQTIPLGDGVKWDYLHFDAPTDRLYVSHGGQVDVVDARRYKLIGELANLPGSHGIAVDPITGLVYADSAVDSRVLAFNPATLKPVASAPVLLDADGVTYDPFSRQIFVSGGDGDGLTPVSTATGKAGASIALGSSPEFHVVDGAGSLYVDLVDANEIARIDTKTNRIVAHWPLGPCQHPKGLAIDAIQRLLFASCANGVMAVVNANTGALLAALPIGKRTDAAAYDPVRHLALSSNGDGTLSIVSDSGGHLVLLATVRTAPGARTMAIDPTTGRIFLVTANVLGMLLPKTPGAAPQFKFVPGSLHVLVYAP